MTVDLQVQPSLTVARWDRLPLFHESRAVHRILSFLSRNQVQTESTFTLQDVERLMINLYLQVQRGHGVTKRSNQGAETRLRIIAAAADLFHKQGVHATSPDDVIEASGTGKGQFYHYFKSKEGLVHEVLQTHLEAIRTGSALVKYEIESWEDLERWFRAHLELQKRFRMTRGCPFGTIGNQAQRMTS